MPTTPAKKTAAKKTAPRRPARTPVQDIPMPEIDVLDLHSQDAAGQHPDLAEVFRLDGRPYFIDRNRGAGVAMKMLKLIRTEGENAAMANFLLDVLGDEAFEALSNFPGVKVAHLQTVMLACTKALLGDKDAGPKA
jgi:hypothetical protein